MLLGHGARQNKYYPINLLGKKNIKTWSARSLLRGCADARSGVGQEQWHNFQRTTLTIGDRIARPATIHWHECVKGREHGQNTARAFCDQAIAKFVGQCGLMTDELNGLILISRHFKDLFSLCWRGERLTKIPRPEYDKVYAGKWCLNIGRLSLGPSPCQDSGTNMPT